MGWIRGLAPTNLITRAPEDILEQRTKTEQNFEHVEYIRGTPGDQDPTRRKDQSEKPNKYFFQPLTVTDEDLPFIPSEVVLSKRRPGALSGKANQADEIKDYWIVVDNIVFDCSSFIDEHPGGEQVILSFVGEDCSWQFWRFHGENEMEQYGKELRIGRTKGVANRFAEPVRFVGLSKLGDDDW